MQRTLLSLALIVICGAALSRAYDKEAVIAMYMKHAETCQAELGSAQSDMDEMMKKLPASTHEGKCLRACIMKKIGVLDANGKLDKAAGLEKAKMFTDNDPAKVKMAQEIADTCAAVSVPDDECEAAALYGKCFMEQAIKHGLHD